MTDVCTQGLDTGFVGLGYAKVAFLGVIQGITELLPISSTAHMRVVPAVLGWQDPGSAFSAAMQLAALAAVVSYFWSDIREVAVGSLAALARRDYANCYFRLAVGIVLATVPIVIAGLALSSVLNACNSPLRGIAVIGLACIVMAVLLALSEIYASHRLTLDKVSVLDALLVGIAQVGALIPGVSRSGSTLTAALGLGYARPEAARLSFLLGLPAIALAGLKELWELHKIHLGAYGWSVLAVGLVVASISAFFAIWGLMRVLERFSAWPFVIYRGLLGVVLLIGVAVGWLS
ncbi:undecaprenyl-diphosphate phosphatase [Mesorhizobium sp. M1C.F.Ca.ET.193.01.1.1]|uniref:undecaprenyl-diphosphate phosphatase n=1 Tax=unclassified Mesorhizobium TaxID=325217 RepID=UPI000FD43839|nr:MULTISPECIES: undecaprenyl-diphosphate phosphatase [unclassified Mesorhizobium]TGT00455.1 undecaprenyl-diphosphate phosphatase [bacterium M00.F.Ca.ET.177.01.1.1]TGQ53869.1 undecaprenyl-diphosphate phosphatase [Mesorhizobium sp. M1C.F.Ca.ET.210.01.1.1]TGQ71892.1 undecaprenyl-diphosphate phosphatase [Mesorhizobium sp. M1C.F.Ca.ET.212.01.1.1]TGR08616.1 undecaprenyl-diphosphate phosphatase [Mesorhizobium sp. M1C.F.Ca.ET.204.01.1.1]TGR29352.1 undecaprenyl-diphosphate phosphatase [Mesorhizobium s